MATTAGGRHMDKANEETPDERGIKGAWRSIGIVSTVAITHIASSFSTDPQQLREVWQCTRVSGGKLSRQPNKNGSEKPIGRPKPLRLQLRKKPLVNEAIAEEVTTGARSGLTDYTRQQ
ncbi:hypothetical protein Y032_0913g3013 [Ancylostoma ceylanicum]|nr:hypothetical protein Y032_0913g3013 [Ancylostoma ceylanicum]